MTKRVVVVGAGLAGLAAALELADAGREVVVLEAQRRVGGRILTLREPLPEGAYVEAGASHVVGDPDLLALATRAGVKLVTPEPPKGLASITCFGSERSRFVAGVKPKRRRAFSPEEESLEHLPRIRKYFGAVDGVDPAIAWPPPQFAPYDAQSGAQMLAAWGASQAYIDEIGSAFLGESIGDVSAAFLMREMAGFFRDLDARGGGYVEGGTDRLPSALGRELGSRVVLGAEVTRLAQGEDGARVTYVENGRLAELEAERVVCAIPFSVLRSVEIAPALSPPKRRAVHELRMVSVARAYALFDRRFWLERGDAGGALTDDPLGTVYDESKPLSAAHGVLGAYLCSSAARRYATLSAAERASALVAHLERVHPSAREHLVTTFDHCWDDAPFARGAYAWFAPGQMIELGPALAAPEGRIHFAGDHTSHRPGWMHGAVASAKRVVREILAAE